MCRRSFAVVEIRSDCSTLFVVMEIKSVCETLIVVMGIKSVCETLIVAMGIKSVCATLFVVMEIKSVVQLSYALKGRIDYFGRKHVNLRSEARQSSSRSMPIEEFTNKMQR